MNVYTSVWQPSLLARHHTSTTAVPAVRVHVCENPEHVIPQRQRLEGGGDDDVAALRERDPHEHCAGVDVGGRGHALLGQDVVQPILPVQFHLGMKKKHLGFVKMETDHWLYSSQVYSLASDFNTECINMYTHIQVMSLHM